MIKYDDKYLLYVLDQLYIIAVIQYETILGLYETSSGEFFKHKHFDLKHNRDWFMYVGPEFHFLFEEAKKRGLDWQPKELAPDFGITLTKRGDLERYIVGSLRDSINCHGPITHDNASSAGKRLIGGIKSWSYQQEKKCAVPPRRPDGHNAKQ